MSDNLKDVGGQIDKLQARLKEINVILKAACETAQTNQKDVGQCALKQAQENTTKLFEALSDMMSAQNPAAVARIYAEYLSSATKTQAEQMREIGALLSKSNKAAWEPVVKAISGKNAG